MISCRTFHTAPEQGQGLTPIAPIVPLPVSDTACVITPYRHRLQTYYRPQRSCSKVMFLCLSVNHSVHRGGLCPSMHHRSHDQRGSLSRGVSVWGGPLSRGSLSGGGLSRGVSVRKTPYTVTSGRYASHWNAFLF